MPLNISDMESLLINGTSVDHPGGYSSPHVVQSCSQSSTLGPLVLQKGPGIQQVGSISWTNVTHLEQNAEALTCLHWPLQQSEETHEAAAKENQDGDAEPEPGRPI